MVFDRVIAMVRAMAMVTAMDRAMFRAMVRAVVRAVVRDFVRAMVRVTVRVPRDVLITSALCCKCIHLLFATSLITASRPEQGTIHV